MPTIADLEKRLARLEAQASWTRRLGIVAVLFAAALGVSGQANRAQDIDAGIVKARAFMLTDFKGKLRGFFQGDDDGVVLYLADRNEQQRIRLFVGADGKSLLSFWNEDGKERIRLSAEGESTFLRFVDEGGKVRAGLGLASNNIGLLSFGDQTGTTRYAVTSSREIKATMWGADKRVLWSAP